MHQWPCSDKVRGHRMKQDETGGSRVSVGFRICVVSKFFSKSDRGQNIYCKSFPEGLQANSTPTQGRFHFCPMPLPSKFPPALRDTSLDVERTRSSMAEASWMSARLRIGWSSPCRPQQPEWRLSRNYLIRWSSMAGTVFSSAMFSLRYVVAIWLARLQWIK